MPAIAAAVTLAAEPALIAADDFAGERAGIDDLGAQANDNKGAEKRQSASHGQMMADDCGSLPVFVFQFVFCIHFSLLTMTPQQKAESLGLTFAKQARGYLNLCVRSGNQLITSGHVSDLKGKLGAGVSTEDGYKAAKNCAEKVLRSVWDTHGTLDGLKVIKVLGCVNSTLEYSDQHLVINGCSDLLHEIFGKEGDGYHARSALGFAQLPTGAAVEVEAIFEIKA
jgi:enamine deaminase RidA (YjgF/YER057c/UK114 family)